MELEVFMELAAEALAVSDVDGHRRINHEDLLSTHLLEVVFDGKQNRRVQYAFFTMFAAHGGFEPDLLKEVRFWIEDDALDAAKPAAIPNIDIT